VHLLWHTQQAISSIVDNLAFCQALAQIRQIVFLRRGSVIKVKVPELLKQRGLNATDLMRKANIAYATAYRLSKGKGTAISFDVLDALCKFFEVQVKDILEYTPD
jgi:DNA-binding Xre family transcriptional regulator